MTKISRFFLCALIAAVAGASPALAQYAAQTDRSPATQSRHAKIADRESAAGRVYDMVPTNRSEDPALTGGGSLGYNDNLRHDAW